VIQQPTYLRTDNLEYQQNRKEFLQRLQAFRDKMHTVMKGGGEKALKKHRDRGKLLARERIELLLDEQASFLEFSPLAADGQYNDAFPAAGIVTGTGVIQGREAVIVANDATVKGGTYVRETIRKHVRAQEIALQNHLPVVYLVDSGGVFLPEQARVFPDKEDFGRFFYNQSRMSALGIPQIAVVMGSCTAGGAYVPAMSDETIIVRNQGTIFIGGPPLVKAATGEDVSAEELGGAEVHTKVSGVADHIAEDDEEALAICRTIFEALPKPQKQPLEVQEAEAPAYNPEELYGLIPLDLRKRFNMREILLRLIDGSRFHEFKPGYAPTIITGFARINGYPVGVLANNGVIYAETARKAAHFIELCQFRKLPLVFLQNITGFIVGKKYEHEGIARDGAKMIHAVANAQVPKFTIIVGGSYGAGNYAMAGRAYEPNLLFMWPNAKIGVMGGEQAAGVMTSVKVAQLKKQGKTPDEQEIEDIRQSMLERYEQESSVWYSTSRVWDDGVIDPLDTRRVLAIGIEMARNQQWGEPQNGIFRM